MSSSVALLKVHDYGAWTQRWARGETAGRLGPYSVDLLEEHGFELRYSDATFHEPWTWPLLTRGLGWLGWRRAELIGLENALANRRLVRGADLTLGIFEDQGSFAAFARGRRLRTLAPRRMALLVCWMADRATRAGERVLRSYRRVLAGADLIVFFSRNQAAIYEELLGVDPARLAAVPFGIDEQFFAALPPRDDGYVLAVGNDTSRDHELLVQAVAGSDAQTHIYGPRRAETPLPANVTWRAGTMDHLAYREALAGASMVVVPTTAPVYPGGQTVILEAMAAGRPVITTRSEAMRDYITDGVNGLLVARGDVSELRRAIDRVRGDRAFSASLAANGRAAVHSTFNQRAMWTTIAKRLDAVLASTR